MTAETIAHATAIVAEKGSDAWWQLDLKDLLPASFQGQVDELRKGEDTMVSVSLAGYLKSTEHDATGPGIYLQNLQFRFRKQTGDETSLLSLWVRFAASSAAGLQSSCCTHSRNVTEHHT